MAKRYNRNCGMSWAQWHKYQLEEDKRLAELEANPTDSMKLHKQWVETLIPLTQDLKGRYLTSTEKWATEQVERNIQRRKDYAILREGFKTLNKAYVKTLPEKEQRDYKHQLSTFMIEQKWYYNSPAWYITPEFVVRSVKAAELHYEESINKLAARLAWKKMAIDKVEVINGRVGVNLDMAFTDGDNFVKAWTIIAEGPIQRPHYRYLIK